MEPASRSHQIRLEQILRSPGPWLLIGGLEALFMIHISEFLYPGYSVSENYISDLGVGPMPSRVVFALGVMIFGIMAFVAAYLLRRDDRKSKLWSFIAMSGIGAIGVGVFDMEFATWPHRAFALLAFFFGNLAALYSFRVVHPPLSIVFAALGLIGLSALCLFGGATYLGLGIGGMERLILYPAMFWIIGFGAYLSATDVRLNPK